jgi:hypothetical protein
MSLFPEPSAAEILAATFDGRGEIQGKAVARLISMRVPVHLLIRIDAFALHSGLNRTQVLNRFIEAGIDATWPHLSPATQEAISEQSVAAASALGFPEFSKEDLAEAL